MSRAKSSDYRAAYDAYNKHIDTQTAFEAEMRRKYGNEWQTAAAPSDLRMWNAMQRRREQLEEIALQAWLKRR